jgi:hypothetical protein
MKERGEEAEKNGDGNLLTIEYILHTSPLKPWTLVDY